MQRHYSNRKYATKPPDVIDCFVMENEIARKFALIPRTTIYTGGDRVHCIARCHQPGIGALGDVVYQSHHSSPLKGAKALEVLMWNALFDCYQQADRGLLNERERQRSDAGA